jgi:fermentation-respiration switch protein FrsA (DUF1100 family)
MPQHRIHQRTAKRRGLVAAALLLTAPLSFTVARADVLPPPVPSLPGSEDAFYTPPSPLPTGKPGDVLKTRDISTPTYPNIRIKQVMYLSTNTQGRLIPVTGALLTPLNQRPGTDNPIVVNTPGTRGLGDQCAPSKQANLLQADPASPDYEIGGYEQFLLKGISVVVTDYEGAGTPGLPSYLVGPTEGKAGLDAVRAAQHISGSGVSPNSPVGINGYSQGGQAAGWAAELQPKYAPELKLKGVLAGGVPTDMNVEINHLNGNPTAGAGFALAALVGLDVAYPKLDLADRLTPAGEQVIQHVESSCYSEYVTAFGTTSTGDVTRPDVLADPTWQSLFAKSRLGTTAPGAPAYVYHGTTDTIVPYSQGSTLYHDWCAHRASVEFETIVGADHISSGAVGSLRGVQWLIDRLGGVAPAPGCLEVGIV